LRGLPSQLPFLKNYKWEIKIGREVIFGKPGRRWFERASLSTSFFKEL